MSAFNMCSNMTLFYNENVGSFLFQISIKYDPFMNLSVPLPKEQKLLPVVIFFKDCKRVPLKVTKFTVQSQT